MTPKRKSTPSQNPLHSGAPISSNPTRSHIRFHDKNARKAFLEKFSLRGIHSECQVILANFADTDLPDVIHSRGSESLCDVPVTCPSVLIQEFYSNMHGFDFSVPHFITRIRDMRIVFTPEIVSDVLRVHRVEFLDYPGCERLTTVSKDELKSIFCKRPSDWGERQFTYYSAFAKGPRFFNMVMTFILHPLSHYNFITEPRARFLLPLLKHLTIDFPSYFILSIIDVHRDSASRHKLIFPSAITRILRHFSIPFPASNHFFYMCVIDATIVKWSEAQFRLRQSRPAVPSSRSALSRSAPSTSAPSSSMGNVTLEDIMTQLQRMDARLDTLSTELYQVNVHVGHITRQQAIIGGFTLEASPPPPLVASEAEDDDDDDDDDDGDTFDDDDGDASSSDTDEMSI